MATRGEDLDLAILYTLQRLGCEAMILKPEQRVSMKYAYEGKDTSVWLPTGLASLCATKFYPSCLM